MMPLQTKVSRQIILQVKNMPTNHAIPCQFCRACNNKMQLSEGMNRLFKPTHQ
jgi:hypothetical protein